MSKFRWQDGVMLLIGIWAATPPFHGSGWLEEAHSDIGHWIRNAESA